MNGVWRSLLWKEWREQRLRLLAVLSLPLMLLPVPWFTGPDFFATSLFFPIVLFSVPAICVFIGAGLGAGEQSQRTIGFLQSLPVNTSRAAVAKLLFGTMAVFLPWVLMSLIVFVWERSGLVDKTLPLVGLFLLLMGGVSATLVIWSAAASANLSDEVRGGSVAFLALFAPWSVIGVVSQSGRCPEWLVHYLMAAAPGGFATVTTEFTKLQQSPEITSLTHAWLLFVTAAVVNVAVTYAFVRRFGKVAPRRIQGATPAKSATGLEWLPPPRRRQWTAILWKQFRETAPLAMIGAGGILCISLLVNTLLYRESPERMLGEFTAQLAITVWTIAGILISMVAGIGLFMDDLRPELNYFWRSRPINVDQWFFVRFFASLVGTIAALALPTALILLAVKFGGNVTRGFLVLDVLAQAVMFSISMAAMVFIQRPVLAAIAAVLVGVLGSLLISTVQFESATTVGIASAAFGAAAVVAAWWGVRNDWRWQS